MNPVTFFFLKFAFLIVVKNVYLFRKKHRLIKPLFDLGSHF